MASRIKPKHCILQRDDPIVKGLFIAIPFDGRYYLNDADSDTTLTEWPNLSDIGVLSNDHTAGTYTLHALRQSNTVGQPTGEWIATEYGRAWDIPNTHSFGIFIPGYLTQSAGTNSDYPPITISTHCQINIDTAEERHAWSIGSGSATLRLQHDNAPDELRFQGMGATLNSSGAVRGRILHCICIAAPGRQELWIDGVLVESATANTLTIGGALNQTNFGNLANAARNFGPYVDFRVWDRALPQAECKSLWDEPWRMYQVRTKAFAFATAAAPGGPTPGQFLRTPFNPLLRM